MTSEAVKTEVFERVARLAHNEADTIDKKMQNYDAWSSSFDRDVDVLEYTADKLAAVALKDAVDTSTSLDAGCSVLDVAAGTGRVCRQLRRLGFVGPVDAVDGSKEMLRVGADLYKRTYCHMISENSILPPDAEPTRYDAAVMAGAIGGGQVPVSSVRKLVELVRRGGACVVTARRNSDNLEVVARLDELIAEMCDARMCERLFVRDVERFELATSGHGRGDDYIPGRVYCLVKL